MLSSQKLTLTHRKERWRDMLDIERADILPGQKAELLVLVSFHNAFSLQTKKITTGMDATGSQVEKMQEMRVVAPSESPWSSPVVLVMPFGLMESSAVFQWLMQQVLKGLNPAERPGLVFIYVDDILVFSANLEDHIGHLRLVLEQIVQANLKLKPSKCHFIYREIEYLGHVRAANQQEVVAVLSQSQDDGASHPVAYASRSLTRLESNYEIGDTGSAKPLLSPIPVQSSFQIFGVDLIELPVTSQVPDQKSERIVKLLAEEAIPLCGDPEALPSDCGTNLVVTPDAYAVSCPGIKKLNTTAYHMQCDGIVQRFM
eukprot:Em0020g878a